MGAKHRLPDVIRTKLAREDDGDVKSTLTLKSKALTVSGVIISSFTSSLVL